MALAAHTVRRSAIYYWRRRLPSALGGKTLLISFSGCHSSSGRTIYAAIKHNKSGRSSDGPEVEVDEAPRFGG